MEATLTKFNCQIELTKPHATIITYKTYVTESNPEPRTVKSMVLKVTHANAYELIHAIHNHCAGPPRLIERIKSNGNDAKVQPL